MQALGALFILLGFVLFVGGLVCSVWAIVHAASRRDEQFRAAGQVRALWLVLLVVGFFLQPIGLLLGLVYVTVVRRQVDRASALLPSHL
jgi:hypothetical protein